MCDEVLSVCVCVKVIVTVPLAVLKANMVAFSPPLSPRKKKAIESIGAGLVEKVRTVCSKYATPIES